MKITVYDLYPNSSRLFPIEPADFKREWMDQYNNNFAYRCLPLKIANESGWLIRSPIDFSLIYRSDGDPKQSVDIEISDNDKIYRQYIISHFGRGVVTITLPYLFHTPDPWCLWVRGYPNYYKDHISYLEGIVETYWSHSTFTYNFRVCSKDVEVKFSKGDPLCFFTLTNLTKLNFSTIEHKSISINAKLQKDFSEWSQSRSYFNANQASAESWQKDYFLGKLGSSGQYKNDNHLTTIKTNVINDQ